MESSRNFVRHHSSELYRKMSSICKLKLELFIKLSYNTNGLNLGAAYLDISIAGIKVWLIKIILLTVSFKNCGTGYV